MRKLNFKLPKNKKDALRAIATFDLEWNNVMSIKNKRTRCSGLRKIHRATNFIFLAAKDKYKLDGDEHMREVAAVFAKWIRSRGYIS